MKNILAILLFSMTVFSVSASQSDLDHWFASEIDSHQYVLAQVEQENSGVDYVLKTIRVRLRATLSVELPLIAKGKVRPEIELYYTR